MINYYILNQISIKSKKFLYIVNDNLAEHPIYWVSHYILSSYQFIKS